MNFLICQGLAVLHDKCLVVYMDLPQLFDRFYCELSSLTGLKVFDLQSLIAVIKSDIDNFISKRIPKEVSNAFWKGIYS